LASGGSIGFGALLVAAACGNKTVLPPGGGDCVSCTSGTTGTTGGMYRDATPSADARESGRDAPTERASTSATVTFNVARTNDTSFVSVSPYDALVRVSAVGATGDVVTSGDVNGAGSVDGVATGPNWFAVRDPIDSTKILPTLQPIDVNPVTPVAALVVVGASQLTPLVVDQQPWVPLKGRATLILIFTHGGRLVDGISLGPILPAGASVAYEQGGSYITPMTNPDVTTDIEGTAIVRDISDLPTYPAMSSIKFGYRLGTATLSFDANLAADYVTRMAVAVP
jgi:hypothetical protein